MTQLKPQENSAALSVRAYLKSATRQDHVRAEARWTNEGTFADRRTYQAWLGRMLDVHDALGFSAAKRSRWHSAAAIETSRHNALCQDLGLPAKRHNGAGQSLDHDEAWGALYALNGSALGASILLKQGIAQFGWPVAYLSEMRRFATSGALGAFFPALDVQVSNREAALTGALAVFRMIASETISTAPIHACRKVSAETP